MTNPVTTIRAEIEAEIASFSANAARGASHLSFNHLPSILLRMLDMVEHYTGKGLELAEADIAEVKKTVSADSSKVTTPAADLVKKVEQIAAKVETNTAAIEEVKEVVPALSETPADDEKRTKAKKPKDA